MRKNVRDIANLARKITLENKQEYQRNHTENYHEGDELLEKIIITRQLQFNKSKVLPYLIYNFLSKKKYLYVCVTNMYQRFSEFFEKVDVSNEELAATIFHVANIYLEVCDGDVLETKRYNNRSIDFYNMYFDNRNRFLLFDDFKSFLIGDANFIDVKNLEDVIDYGVFDDYESKNIAILSTKIIEIFSKKDNEIRMSDVQELIKILIICGLSISQAERVASIIRDKMVNDISRRLENIFKMEETSDKNSTEEKTQTPTPNKKEEKPSKYLSDKEYRAIVKEIKKYYDLHSWKLIAEEITSEEREHVASLMVRIGVDQEQLADFLKKSEKVSKTYTYDYFKDHVEEFKFYFGEELNQVFEYMKEIENYTDEEDKEYWIMGINEELEKLKYKNKLDSYEYEAKLMKEVQE